MQDWIEDNKFLTGWIVVTVIGCVMLTMNLLKARGAYDDAYARFETAREQVRNLEGKPLYPSKENVEKKAQSVGVYRDAVRELHSELAALQRPLRNVEQTELVSKLKGRIQEISRDARRLDIKLPEGFSFGMPQYVNNLPPTELCPLLDYQLDAIFSLCSVLLSKGVSSIESLERDGLQEQRTAGSQATKGRGKQPVKEAEPVVRRYPVKIVFKTKPDGLREFLNVVSNPAPGAPFHVVRMIRIANQKQTGPLRGRGEKGRQSFVGDQGEVAVTGDLVGEDAQFSGAEESDLAGEFAQPPVADSTVDDAEESTVEDAEFVLGQEAIEVYMEIELLRFAPPKAAAEAAAGSGRAGMD